MRDLLRRNKEGYMRVYRNSWDLRFMHENELTPVALKLLNKFEKN